MTYKSELKACGICGGRAVWKTEDDYLFVECEDCHAHTGVYDTVEAARDAWENDIYAV